MVGGQTRAPPGHLRAALRRNLQRLAGAANELLTCGVDPPNRYVETIVGNHTATDPAFDGVFIDGPIASSQACCAANYTLASRQAMFNGVAAMLRDATALLSAHGKVLTASLGSHFSDLSRWYSPSVQAAAGVAICPASMRLDSLEPCCAYGEEKIYETVGDYERGARMFAPFRQFNIPSRDFGDAAHGGNDTLGCAAAVLDVAAEAVARPVFVTNNDGWPNSSAVDQGWHWSQHNVSLAAYLMAATEVRSDQIWFRACLKCRSARSFKILASAVFLCRGPHQPRAGVRPRAFARFRFVRA